MKIKSSLQIKTNKFYKLKELVVYIEATMCASAAREEKEWCQDPVYINLKYIAELQRSLVHPTLEQMINKIIRNLKQLDIGNGKIRFYSKQIIKKIAKIEKFLCAIASDKIISGKINSKAEMNDELFQSDLKTIKIDKLLEVTCANECAVVRKIKENYKNSTAFILLNKNINKNK
ncbi:hypothetical protein BpHYR1_003151 [Brachionus plicatilis]|uniref:Uncharacterized protein n=1 Tax=Brachionus plicatilis TaxID=10195 RepID=A0A3M7QBL2_BRAPC|nr:hypothetical protein BpHYR1_003151 [Brachionus plicatilis]